MQVKDKVKFATVFAAAVGLFGPAAGLALWAVPAAFAGMFLVTVAVELVVGRV